MKIECRLTVGDDSIVIDRGDDKYTTISRQQDSLADAIASAIRGYDASRYGCTTLDVSDTLEAAVVNALRNREK